MRFPRQQDVLGAAGEVGFVFVGEGGDGKGVPAEGVGIVKPQFKLTTNCINPDPVYS